MNSKSHFSLSCAFIISLWLWTASSKESFAQGVGINTIAPDNSSVLDAVSADKGVLIPRISLTGTDDISTVNAPANSLLIYNTTSTGSYPYSVTPGFYYWTGSAWSRILSGNAVSTAWMTGGNTGTQSGTHYLGTGDATPLEIRTNNILRSRVTTKGQIELFNTGRSVLIGESAGSADDLSSNENVFIGYQSGMANTSGEKNIGIGSQSLLVNLTGSENTAIGHAALWSNTTGSYNTATGTWSLLYNTTGTRNTANGWTSLSKNVDGNDNTAAGYYSLGFNTSGDDNTANGTWALASNTTGDRNTAGGWGSLANNISGNENTADGWGSLRYNTTGIANVAIGYQSLYNNTDGEGNVAIGHSALQNNLGGDNNVATGKLSMPSNTTGNFNTANGTAALYSNVSGSVNTSMGAYSLNLNTTGSENTGIGQGALEKNTTGNGNSAIGYAAGPNTGALLNTTALGTFATTTANNQVRIGNGVTSIGGPANWTNTSDGRFKENVTENVPGLDFILQLRPVTYNLNWRNHDRFIGNDDKMLKDDHYAMLYAIRHTGFIAQEVEFAANNLGFDFSGIDRPDNANDPYGLRYAEFTVPLVRAVQEQQEIIAGQQQIISDQQKAITALSMEIQEVKLMLEKISERSPE